MIQIKFNRNCQFIRCGDPITSHVFKLSLQDIREWTKGLEGKREISIIIPENAVLGDGHVLGTKASASCGASAGVRKTSSYPTNELANVARMSVEGY